MAFVTIATVADVSPGQVRQVTIQGKQLALFNVHGTFYAIDDTCPHRGAPLSEGECEGTEVICPWHGARFDVTSGQHLSPPASRGVASFKVQVVGNEVQVEV